MLLFLVALSSSTTNQSRPPITERPARVSITVLRAHSISARSWNPNRDPLQREIITIAPDGSPQLIRLTEFQ